MSTVPTIKPRVVMPAIYRFIFPDDPNANKLRWHRAIELYEAINNILVSQGEAQMTACEIGEKYIHLSPFKRSASTPYQANNVSADGHSCWMLIGGSVWFSHAIQDDLYLSAKTGVKIIRAVKHPVWYIAWKLVTMKLT